MDRDHYIYPSTRLATNVLGDGKYSCVIGSAAGDLARAYGAALAAGF
jgi:hypothetical protein